jgi:hypothetical protein
MRSHWLDRHRLLLIDQFLAIRLLIALGTTTYRAFCHIARLLAGASRQPPAKPRAVGREAQKNRGGQIAICGVERFIERPGALPFRAA